MKKIVFCLAAAALMLLTACGKDSIEGNTWYKTRTVSEEGVTKDSTIVSIMFNTDKDGTSQRENIHTIYATEEMPQDSVKRTVVATPFTYTYSNGTGILYYSDGSNKIYEFNIRHDKMIMQGITYDKK